MRISQKMCYFHNQKQCGFGFLITTSTSEKGKLSLNKYCVLDAVQLIQYA